MWRGYFKNHQQVDANSDPFSYKLSWVKIWHFLSFSRFKQSVSPNVKGLDCRSWGDIPPIIGCVLLMIWKFW